jgi:hypothetical protein
VEKIAQIFIKATQSKQPPNRRKIAESGHPGRQAIRMYSSVLFRNVDNLSPYVCIWSTIILVDDLSVDNFPGRHFFANLRIWSAIFLVDYLSVDNFPGRHFFTNLHIWSTIFLVDYLSIDEVFQSLHTLKNTFLQWS